jgi:type I restriction enzyme S subunit
MNEPRESLPVNWEYKNLKDLARVVSGGTPSRANPDFWNGSIPWATPTDITRAPGRLLTRTAERITAKGLRASSANLLPAGAVLMTSRATLGEAKLSTEPTATNQGFKSLVPSENVDGLYLLYQLTNLKHEYSNYGIGTTFLEVNKRDTERFRVPIPTSFDEQRRIAKVLSTVDDEIELVALLVEKSEAIRAGLIRDALQRCFGAPLEPLAKLAQIGSGITLGRKFDEPGTANYPYLRVANVQDGHVDLTEVKTLRLPQSVAARAMLRPGDVLMNEGGDFDKLGRGAVWRGQIPNCLHQNHVFRVRCNQELLLPDFLALWAASEFGKKFFMLASKQSTNLASINSTQLKKFPVLRPSPDEQRDVLRAVEVIDSVLELNRAELAGLRLLKQGLARDLLTGKVRVPS